MMEAKIGQAILVVDFGTSKLHAVYISLENGMSLGEAERPYDWDVMEDNRAVVNPETLWVNSQRCLDDLLRQETLEYVEIAAMVFSFLGDNFICMDGHDHVLYPLIAGSDWRAKDDMPEIERQINTHDYAKITGTPLDCDLSFPRMYWIKKHEGEIFSRTKKFYSLQQYIMRKMGLEPLSDYSLAARTAMYDLQEDRWNGRLMDILGISDDMLGKVCPAGTVVGTIEKYGDVKLPQKVPVILGGHDAMEGFIGLGFHPKGTPGMIGNLAGSYNLVGLPWNEFRNTDDVWIFGLMPGLGSVPGSYHFQAGDNMQPTVRWFVEAFLTGVGMGLNDMSAKVKYDASCAVRMSRDPLTGDGCFEGISVSTRIEDLFTALMEAHTFRLRELYDVVTQLIGEPFSCMRVGAGGAKADNLNQFKADFFGIRVERVKNLQASAVGAAVIAAVGMGAYQSFEDAIKNMVSISKVFEPDVAIGSQYREKFKIFQRDKGKL